MKRGPARMDVDYLGVLETGSLGLCSLAVIMWMSIGTLSRTVESEKLAQRVIAVLCFLSAVMLFSLHYSGGELWESRNVARPFAVFAVIFGLSSMMSIKGTDVQGETNPHKIMKSRREEE